MTPSPGTIRRSAAIISGRRRIISGLGVGICIVSDPAAPPMPWSALARLVARIGLVDDVDAPFAAHDAAVLVAAFERLQRVDDFHTLIPRTEREHRERVQRSQICVRATEAEALTIRRRR